MIFTTLDEFYFTTSEKKLLENCRCIVPDFTNDYFIYIHNPGVVYRPYSLVPDPQSSRNCEVFVIPGPRLVGVSVR
jgi:hypothetical protein